MMIVPCERPFFIVGTERSGSNLLRVILDAHPRLSVPHPPHLMKYFKSLESGYGDLSQPEQLRELIRDVHRLMRVHIHPWLVTPSPQDIEAACRQPSLLGVFTAIYDLHLRDTKKPRWGCKSTFVIHHIPEILETYPEARFIWLVRDPRDVVASSRRSVFSPFHPVLTAELWTEQQALGAEMEQAHPGLLHRLRYEDLLRDPVASLQGLMDFLGEDYEEELLQFFTRSEARRGAQLSESWQKVGSPIDRGNQGRYREGLTPEEIWQVEAVCGGWMDALGYPRDYPEVGPLRLRSWQRLEVEGKDLLWRLQIEARSLRRDKNHWRRWARGAWVSWLAWRRAAAA